MTIRSRSAVMVLGLAVALTACGGSESGGRATAPHSTSPPAGPGEAVSEVMVTADVDFAAGAPDLAVWSDPSLDVYAPTGATGMPLAVILPPHALTKENPASAQLATAIAEQGAVAVVANWSQLTDPADSFRDPTVLTEVARAGQSVAGCAVSYAVSRADEFGADPARLVLVGELFGANTASVIALGIPDPYTGCAADETWTASRFVGINGDWLVTLPLFDPVAGAAIETMSPWSLLDRAPKVSTVLAVTDDALGVMRNCGDADAALAQRDTDGTMRARLDAGGAADDGCIDVGEIAEATAAEMIAHDFDVESLLLSNTDGATRSDAGAHVEEFGPTDLAILVAAILNTAA